MRRGWPALLLAACCSLTGQQTAPANRDRTMVIAPLYDSYLTDSEAEFKHQAQLLKANIGTGRNVLIGFASFVHMAYEDTQPMMEAVDSIVRRAKESGIVAHISLISGFFHDSNDLRTSAIQDDVRNAQWFSDGWIADPASLHAAATVPSNVWITPSRYARDLRKRMETGARLLGAHLASQFASNADVLVSVSGDAEVEFSYERNLDSGERQIDRASPVYADYSPFLVEEFRDWIRATRYSGDMTPATDDNHDGHTFNRDYKQSFRSWNLRYFEQSGPISFATYQSLREKLPSQGPYFIEGGFDAPRVEKPQDPFWRAWTEFRPQVLSNYLRDFAAWITTSPDPKTHKVVPSARFYSHQIPADFLFGENNNLRLKTSGSYASTALLAPLAATGVTVFNTFDGTTHKKTGTEALFRKLSSSIWGIFEYNPSVPTLSATEPSADVKYYVNELKTLDKFHPSVIVPFAWSTSPHLKAYRIQGRAFEKGLKEFVAGR